MALDPTGMLPFTPPFGAFNDKFLHAGAFALLAAIVTLRGPAPRALIALVVLAVVIETAQIIIPEREADLGDLAASLAGIALAWLVVAAGRVVIRRIVSVGSRI
jgi:VanZ family protein